MTLFNKALKLNGINGYKYGLPKLFIVDRKKARKFLFVERGNGC